MEAAEELPQESMLEDASPDSTAAEHDAMLDGEPARGDKSSSDSSSSEDDEPLGAKLTVRELSSSLLPSRRLLAARHFG